MSLTEDEMHAERQRLVRLGNEKLRAGMPASLIGGRHKAVFSGALTAADADLKNKVVDAVRAFAAFNEDNDPYGERDMGTVEVDGERIMFKIDYYDNDFQFGSPAPWDHHQTRRLLTMFYAAEY